MNEPPTSERTPSPWPPPALRPDALGQLYNEAYENACAWGKSPEDAHQYACSVIHRHGHDHAMGVPEARRGHGSGSCSCTDGRCLAVDTKAARRQSAGGKGSSPP